MRTETMRTETMRTGRLGLDEDDVDTHGSHVTEDLCLPTAAHFEPILSASRLTNTPNMMKLSVLVLASILASVSAVRDLSLVR